MEKIKLSEITIEKIKNKDFKDFIPELYELEKIIENNPWHNNDKVLDHTISVLVELEQVFRKLDDRTKTYLDKKINAYSRKKLLFLATLFHDIGKKETHKKENDIVKCPGHEEAGALKLETILTRFDLSETEKKFIIEIVRNHGIIHEILNYPEENPEKKIEEFKEEHPNVFLEIILLGIADMIGSQLKDNNPDEFKFRTDSLNKILNNYSLNRFG